MSKITEGEAPSGYVDVHCHLIHKKFEGEEDEVASMCKSKGLEYMIVNGLEPTSNRAILELCTRHSYLLPAVGIYPLDAATNYITEENWTHDFDPPAKFDVDAEIDWIDQMAAQKRISAIGECGLDKHYLKDESTMKEQERVLRLLMKLAVKHSLPIILHSRKAERRVFEMLQEERVEKADFHCFCGKAKLGVQIANAGYYLSIPSALASADPSSSFPKLVQALPFDRILTETDSPYMGPVKGTRNDPSTVVEAMEAIARIKGTSVQEAKEQIRNNFQRLFQL